MSDPVVPRLERRLVHVTDLVVGAKLDESEAQHVAVEDGAFGYLRIGVPEGTEVDEDIVLVLKARVVV